MDVSGNRNGRALAGEIPVLNGSGPPPFLTKTYAMVDDPATDSIVSWGPWNDTFVVWKPQAFARDHLPKYFKHNNFASFVRQLNTYGFRKIDPDRWEFANEGFVRGQKPLLTYINRRKSSHGHGQPQSLPQNASFPSRVQLGKLGLDEDIESLEKDKNILMQELVRLGQQQQTTNGLLQALEARMQEMEQHHQQMMTFLYKVIHNPGLLASLIQQKKSNKRFPGRDKKHRSADRRGVERKIGSSDGQVLNYQRTLLSDALDTRRMSSRSSTVSFQNAPLDAGMPNVPESLGISAIGSSSAMYKFQSSLNMTDTAETITSDVPLEKFQIPSNADILSTNYLASEIENTLVIPPTVVDEMISAELGNFYGDTEIGIFKVGEGMKLPGVVDSPCQQSIEQIFFSQG